MKRATEISVALFYDIPEMKMLATNKHTFWIMFWLSIAINYIIQFVFHPAIVGGNDFISFTGAILGRAIAFLLLPFFALGIMNAIGSFTQEPIRYKILILWVSWFAFFVVSTWGYL